MLHFRVRMTFAPRTVHEAVPALPRLTMGWEVANDHGDEKRGVILFPDRRRSRLRTVTRELDKIWRPGEIELVK